LRRSELIISKAISDTGLSDKTLKKIGWISQRTIFTSRKSPIFFESLFYFKNQTSWIAAQFIFYVFFFLNVTSSSFFTYLYVILFSFWSFEALHTWPQALKYLLNIYFKKVSCKNRKIKFLWHSPRTFVPWRRIWRLTVLIFLMAYTECVTCCLVPGRVFSFLLSGIR
jgi:hypothetical protein